MERVVITDNAKQTLTKLQEQHGKLIFIHSEGCCEGTSPICMKEEDFYLGSRDIQIGTICEVPYYMNESNLPYWEHTQIIIDQTEGLGNSFSLESSYDLAFVIQSAKLH